MTNGTPVSVSVRTAGAVRPLEPAQEHHLLRIGLEALTNAIKHSGASKVDVELRFDEGPCAWSYRTTVLASPTRDSVNRRATSDCVVFASASIRWAGRSGSRTVAAAALFSP